MRYDQERILVRRWFGISAIGQQGIEPGALFAVEPAIDCGEVPELGVDRSHPMFGEGSNQFVLTKTGERRSREGTGRWRACARWCAAGASDRSQSAESWCGKLDFSG